MIAYLCDDRIFHLLQVITEKHDTESEERTPQTEKKQQKYSKDNKRYLKDNKRYKKDTKDIVKDTKDIKIIKSYNISSYLFNIFIIFPPIIFSYPSISLPNIFYRPYIILYLSNFKERYK